MTVTLPRVRSRAAVALAAAAVAFSAGCSKYGTVSGKVTLSDGTPLPGGIITFLPDDPGRNPATAVIHEDGTYTAEVPTGTCLVTIDNRATGVKSAPIGAGGPPMPPKGSQGSGGSGPKYKAPNMPGKAMAGPKSAGPPENKGADKGIEKIMEEKGATKAEAEVAVPGKKVPIDPKYFSTETSGLKVEVHGGTNTFDVKLEGAPDAKGHAK